MTRRTPMVVAVAAAALGALAAPSTGRAAAPPAHPNPALVGLQVDYVNPIAAASGGVASLDPLDESVIAQAVADQHYLTYLRRDDLGGFLPAQIGQTALSSGGRNVIGLTHRTSQIPQFAESASGLVRSFAFTGSGTTVPPPPDQGLQPVASLGTPPPVTPPSNSNTVPPPNQGFGGSPAPTTTTATTTSPSTAPTATSTTTTPPPPTTTTTKPPPTTPPPTTTTTATAPTTTATASGPAATTTSSSPPPPPPSFACGTVGLSLDSNLVGCVIHVTNMVPGGSTTELMAVRNDAGVPFTLALKVTGTTNPLWNDLQMGVWEASTPAPAPLPGLLLWTTQYNDLTTLAPGASITFEIELALPSSAGNADQGRSATMDFNWRATG